MNDIIFRDPPHRRGRGPSAEHVNFAAALKERPGEWAIFKQGVGSSVATSVRHGLYPALRPTTDFETVDRSVNGKHDVYVRFIGKAAS